MSKLSLEEQNRPKRWTDYVGQGQGQGGPVDYLKTVIKYNRHPKAIWCCGNPGSGSTDILS